MEGGGIKDGRSQGLPCKVSEMCDTVNLVNMVVITKKKEGAETLNCMELDEWHFHSILPS